MHMGFNRVVVAGGGVLGSQIALQTAVKGFDVAFWLRSEGSIGRTQPKMEQFRNAYLADLEATKSMIGNPAAIYPRGLIDDFANLTVEKVDALKEQVNRAYDSIVYSTDMASVVSDADLVIESVSEKPADKKAFFEDLAKHLPEHTVIVTNSSTMLPSSFAEYTGRPEKFLALHFANSIWRNNAAEVMGHAETEPAVYQKVVEFAKQIGMIPLQLKKEQPGYLLNSLLIPFLEAAEKLLVNEVSDPQTIDLAWMLGTGAPAGPCRILDIVGLETAYNIITNKPEMADPNSMEVKIAAMLKGYIDAGKTGRNAGEGFYKY